MARLTKFLRLPKLLWLTSIPTVASPTPVLTGYADCNGVLYADCNGVIYDEAV